LLIGALADVSAVLSFCLSQLLVYTSKNLTRVTQQKCMGIETSRRIGACNVVSCQTIFEDVCRCRAIDRFHKHQLELVDGASAAIFSVHHSHDGEAFEAWVVDC
jgi:hypothetical protein